MATWKKIAEAFGRATQDPSATRRGREMIFNTNTVKTRPDGTKSGVSDTDEQLAFDRGALEAADDLGKAIEDNDIPGRSDAIQRQFDNATTRRTDRNLKQNASDEWDEAFARRKQGVRDWYGKDYPQDMAEEGAEAFEKQLWEYVDQLKAKGVPAQDILNRLKGNN